MAISSIYDIFVFQLILCLNPRKLSILVSILNIYHSYKETTSIKRSVHFQVYRDIFELQGKKRILVLKCISYLYI